MSTKPAADQLVEQYVLGDPAGFVAAFRPDALVDINMPKWRYQRRPDALLAELKAVCALPERRVTIGYHEPTADGAVVELVTEATVDGEPRMIREAWLIRTGGELVTALTIYCTAMWEAADIARNRAEEPLPRP
ncbi:MAG TPA: hypothetical protein VIL37_15725 [Natronosporangium sp.]